MDGIISDKDFKYIWKIAYRAANGKAKAKLVSIWENITFYPCPECHSKNEAGLGTDVGCSKCQTLYRDTKGIKI